MFGVVYVCVCCVSLSLIMRGGVKSVCSTSQFSVDVIKLLGNTDTTALTIPVGHSEALMLQDTVGQTRSAEMQNYELKLFL